MRILFWSHRASGRCTSVAHERRGDGAYALAGRSASAPPAKCSDLRKRRDSTAVRPLRKPRSAGA